MNLLYEPRKKALSRITNIENEPEMSEFDSAYLCGIISELRPRKILEIGVAAGATTAIIMQCLNDLSIDDCEFISVDINEKYYRDGEGGRDTGFLGIEMKAQIPGINHRFVLGKVIAGCIDEIGAGIDLVIMDTVHYTPGEILDFPVILPYLSAKAIVVIHDIAYQFYSNKEGFSNIALMNSVTGIKNIPMGGDETTITRLPNIGSIKVTEDTMKNIDSVFLMMLLPWTVSPNESELNMYRDCYVRHYSKELVDIFDIAVKANSILISTSPDELKGVIRRFARALRIMIKGY